MNKNLKYISNKELLSQIKFLVQKERHIHIQVLHHLREIQSRKLYLKLGFSSLFDYTVKELGYSEGAVFRRIKAMKLCQDIPETEVKLQSGKLSLSSACQLQTFFEKQKKAFKDNTDKALKRKTENTEKNRRIFKKRADPFKYRISSFGQYPGGKFKQQTIHKSTTRGFFQSGKKKGADKEN